MAHRLEFLAVDILAEAGAEDGGLEIMGGQGVAGHQGVAEAGPDKALHGLPAVLVEGHCRPEHPDDVAMPAVVFEDPVEFVVGAGEGGLAGAPRAEGEFVGVFIPGGGKAPLVDEDALLAVFAAADHDHLAPEQPSGLNGLDLFPPHHQHRIHPALGDQEPVAAGEADILREVRGGMKAFRGDAVGGGRQQPCRRAGGQVRQGEIGRDVGELELHGRPPGVGLKSSLQV